VGSAVFKEPIRCLIWDSKELPTSEDYVETVLWRAFAPENKQGFVSIPTLIEANAESLRARYLAWVYQLGEFRINGIRLVDHLRVRTGFSYWWLSLIAEKCNFSKSPHITDAIRLFAFSDWADLKAIESLTLVSSSKPLALCLQDWCQSRGIRYNWQRLPARIVERSIARKTFYRLPPAFRALVWLFRYSLARWSLRGAGLAEWRNSAAKTTFVSYLFNLDTEKAGLGRFESPYWGPLTEALQRSEISTNWLHIYTEDGLMPSSRKAAELLSIFNNREKGSQVHVTLDSFLSSKVILKTLSNWVRVAWKGNLLCNSLTDSRLEQVNLWPLFRADWRESTSGITAMSNALFDSIFCVALNSLSTQRIGCYLQENQAWEFALIQNWRAAKHGQLIGVPHSTVRFWHLPYFRDRRSYNDVLNDAPPLPDRVAVNGQAAIDVYLASGYPQDQLVKVEALRYIYLNELKVRRTPRSTSKEKIAHMLVLCDYLQKNTNTQMKLLAHLAEHLSLSTVVTVKPHSWCPVDPAKYPKLSLTISTDPIGELILKCDLVYASSTTSSALEAYCAGVPVICINDPDILNISPIRGFPNTSFVSSPSELRKAIAGALAAGIAKPFPEKFFFLDRSLTKWRDLLNMS
jgi:surface carbohydrate biosynthesis protein (TIGR04326 family)